MKRTYAVVAAPLAVVLAGGIALAARQGDGGPGPGEARLEVDGVAEVTRAGGEVEEVTGGEDLGTGDVVELVDGTGTLELHRGVVLHVRAGREGARDSRVRIDRVPSLLGGQVLAEAGDEAAQVEADDTVVETDGVARLEQGLRFTAAVYQGTGHLRSAGSEPRVERLRQVSVATLGDVSAARPVALDQGDPWDRRVLSDVLELDRELARRANGFTNQVTDRADAAFFRSRYASLDDTVWDGFRADREAGENLVGLAIVSLGGDGSDGARQRRVFEHRAARVGGLQPGWGVVAGLEGVDGDELLDVIDGLFDDSALELALADPSGADTVDGGDAGEGTTGSPGSTGPGGTPGTDGPGASPPGGGGPPTTPPTTLVPVPPVDPPDGPGPTLPPTTLPPTTLPPPLPPLPENPLGGVVDDTTDVVGGVTDVIDDTADDVDDLLGGLLP